MLRQTADTHVTDAGWLVGVWGPPGRIGSPSQATRKPPVRSHIKTLADVGGIHDPECCDIPAKLGRGS